MSTIKTDASVRAAKPVAATQVEYRVEGVRGLALRVSPEGKKTWTLRYRTLAGEQRRQTLGNHPEIGLAEARLATEIALGQVAAGGDPAKARRIARAAAKARKLSSVGDLIEAYLEASEKGRQRPNALPKRASTVRNERHYFERLIKPRFGKRPLAELTRGEVQRFVDEVDANSPSTARIARNVIRQAYNFAIRQEVIDHNPARLIEVTRRPSRERVLSDNEVQAIWSALETPGDVSDLDLGRAIASALQLTALTLQRGGEVVGVHARELDRQARLCTLPGERAKNRKTHVVPLSDWAVRLLDEVFGDDRWAGFAFPSPRDRRRPMTRHALSRAMKRLTTAIGITDATPHDLRRTGATAITSERIGIPRFIVSRVLNQLSDTGGAAAVTGVYDRNEYLSEKRRALDAWAALLAEIVADNESPTNVVRLVESGPRNR